MSEEGEEAFGNSPVTGFDHASVLVQDTAKALEFYCNVLGLEVDPGRPDLPYAGAFLQVGDLQIHLIELPSPDPLEGRPEHGGRDRHIALRVRSVESIRRKLEEAGLPYTMSRSGRAAIFCRDYDGNAYELLER